MPKEIGGMLKIMLKQCGKCYRQKKPNDYVIATGKQYTVKYFVNLVAKELEYANLLER